MLYNNHVQKVLRIELNQSLLDRMFQQWQSYIVELKMKRKDKAMALLMKRSSSLLSSSKHQLKMADLYRQQVVLHACFIKWHQWQAKQRRIKNIVVDRFETMASNMLKEVHLIQFVGAACFAR